MGEATVDQRSPEEIRRDIDATRAELGQTVDQIEDRVSPSKVVGRSQERIQRKVRSRWTQARESVMGSADHGRQQASQRRDAAGDRLNEAEEQVERQVKGNPLAAGLIAFGAGALVSSLLPSSRPEQRLAHTVREQAEPMVRDQLQTAGKEMGQHLAGDVKDAAKDTALAAAQATAETASTAKDAAKETGQHAKDATKDTGQQAKGAAQQTKQS